MTQKKVTLIFIVLLVIDFFLLLYTADSLSISTRDANIFYGDNHNLLWYLTHFYTFIFGNSNISIRLPFITFYILSIVLAYLLSDKYFKKPIDRLISISIFMLLPGMNSAGLLLDNSIIVVFLVLLYLYIVKTYKRHCYVLLTVFLFLDNSFAILFLALFFYSLHKKDNILIVVSLVLFGISMQMYGFDISGRPRGYFLDTFGIYASIFSPILFIYFFYVMYRVAIKGPRELSWYIAFTSLGLSLLFSLRQEIKIVDFAPFVMIAIPLMVKTFLHSYRVRLKVFRTNHERMSKALLTVLIVNFLLLLFNKPLYILLENPKKHFAYKFHVVNDLVLLLKENNITSVLCKDSDLQKRLKFYGVTKGNKYYLTDKFDATYYKEFRIKYYGKLINTSYVLLLK